MKTAIKAFLIKINTHHTDLIEILSAIAVLLWLFLASPHDIAVILAVKDYFFRHLFVTCMVCLGLLQLYASSIDDFGGRRAAAICMTMCWIFLGISALSHHLFQVYTGHPAAAGVYLSLALGNTLAFVKMRL